MRANIENDIVSIECSGGEYLHVKAALTKAIGAALTARRNHISFPLSCMDIAIKEVPAIKNELKDKPPDLFHKHSIARKIAMSSLDNSETKNIPECWCKILDLPQQYAVNAMVTPDLLGLCLFDEQGSGKTVMTISAFDILKRNEQIDSMIVVCPKSMLSGWECDIKKFIPDYSITIADGNQIERRNAALAAKDILVTNYEGVDSILVTLTALSGKLKFLLVVDESYFAKNSEANRSRLLVKLRPYCKRCFVLCGTPAPNSPYDLINQFNIADNGFTFSAFSKSENPDTDKDRIAMLLSERGTFVRRLKNDVLSKVPEKNFKIIRVELTGQQKDIYERSRNSLALELRTYDNEKFRRNLTSYFQKRSVLLQICSIPSSIDPTFHDIPVKYLVLDKLLHDLFSQNRKVIIWTSYKASIKELSIRYADHAPLIIAGDVSTSQRKIAVDTFQNDPTRLLFIANPAAAGAGITLHAAYDAVYLSYTNQAAHYLQSLDRIHRRGQLSDDVNYYLLACRDTIEETEIIRLRTRELQQHDLLGDFIAWPTSLDDALAELSPRS